MRNKAELITKADWDLRYGKELQDCEKYMKFIEGDDYSLSENLRQHYNKIGLDSPTFADTFVEVFAADIRREMNSVVNWLNIDLDANKEPDIAEWYFE